MRNECVFSFRPHIDEEALLIQKNSQAAKWLPVADDGQLLRQSNKNRGEIRTPVGFQAGHFPLWIDQASIGPASPDRIGAYDRDPPRGWG